jgi:cytochrome c553
MRATVTMGLAATFLAFAVVAAVGDEAAAPANKGKELFLSNKCNSCHTIAAQSIEKAAKASETAKPAEAKEAPAAAPAEGATTTTTKKAPDLSAVGLDLKADFIVKYLQKLETIKEKKHMKKFMGTDEELTQVAAWLAEQKDAAAAAKMNGAAKEAPKEEAK